MNLAIVLGRGTLGLELVRACELAGTEVVCLGRSELDICASPSIVAETLRAAAHRTLDQREHGCRIVVFNTAAFTVVDAAESNLGTAYHVNALGAENVAKAVLDLDRLSKRAWRHAGWPVDRRTWSLVHVSTDAVFYEAKNKSELDIPDVHPPSVYGASKLAGERLVAQVTMQGLETYLVRTANLYGVSGRNWASTLREKLLRGDIIDADESRLIAPTWAGWVASAMLVLSYDSPPGTYHLCASQSTRWFGFAREMARSLGLETNKLRSIHLSKTRAADLGAFGGLRSVMSPLRGIEFSDWKVQLEQYLRSVA